jgi:hypothetical protein
MWIYQDKEQDKKKGYEWICKDKAGYKWINS